MMAEILQRTTAPLDYQKVQLSNPDEMRYWCSAFGCSEYELKVAVREAGTDADAVREWLKKYRL